MRKGRELPGAELTAHLDEADQPVLEPRALLRSRRPGERLEPPVNLDRVAGDGDQLFALPTQILRDRDRDRRLPDPGRAEDRQDFQGVGVDGSGKLVDQP